MIKLNTQYTCGLLSDKRIKLYYQRKLNKIFRDLRCGKAKGVEMSAWMNYCGKYDDELLQPMINKAEEWNKSGIKKVVVIGIGGSYLGIKAGVDMLTSRFQKQNFDVLFAHNFNHNYLSALLENLGRAKFGIIVISKSGSTLESAIALELFKNKLVDNIGQEKANKYIVAITDPEKGVLHEMAVKNNWQEFPIPAKIGGRYSALTPAGMFLFILLGIDYKQIIKGSVDASDALTNPNLDENDAFKYAAYRHYFKKYRRLDVENFIVYDPGMQMIGEVYKQIFGESEGKKHKALYPVTSLFTTDLHSVGQYLQEGTRNFFETTLYVNEPIEDIEIPVCKDKSISYVNKTKLSYINKTAMTSTVKAHFVEGKVDNLIIYMDKQDAYHFGYLYTWMCFAAMASAYLHKLNPFDQPGVEIYKKRISNVLKRKRK